MSLVFKIDWREAAKYLAVFIIVFALVYIYRDSRLNSPQAVGIAEPVVIYLEKRSNLDDLIDLFMETGVHFDEEELRWASSILGWRTFNPGRYEMEGAYSYQNILSKIARGIQDHVTVVIPPGIDVGRLSSILGRELQADSASFAVQFRDSSDLALEFDLDGMKLFSRMLPETYNYYWTSTPERAIRRVVSEFNLHVKQRYQEEIELNKLSLDEIITLASIVEWEAHHDDEKPRIGGLYLNRLNRNMLLQADPTVIYALGERRRLLFEDYTIDHPYNTYIHRGLPPGPITNPGLESIRAILFPEDHEYLFMVASPEGGHVFSRTFEEHRIASAQWRRWIREQVRIRNERDRQEQSDVQ